MMTVNKEILLHPDFTADIAFELCEMLEAIIDDEFEKGNETDFDFIDECADAINSIRSGDTVKILPLISRKDFFGRLGIKTESRFRIAAAVCAALAILFAAGTQIKTEENISLLQAFSGVVSEFFKGEKPVEATTAQPAPATTAAERASIIGITVETDPEFKTEYYIGEEFITEGLRVFAEYENGERTVIKADGYLVEVSDSFGAKTGYETVTIMAGNFKQTLEVRVIENLTTVKLNSIYALFPEGFDFTADNLNDIDLDEMQVFAVYSDGSERELPASEYTVEYKQKKTLFEESVTVSVEYEGCSCSFVISKK